MPWDTEHIRQLLDQVVSTKGHASARKAKELLTYVTTESNRASGQSASGRTTSTADADKVAASGH